MFFKASHMRRRVIKSLELFIHYRNPINCAAAFLEYMLLRKKLMTRLFLLNNRTLLLMLPNGLKALCLINESFLKACITTFDEIYIQRVYEKLDDFIPRENEIVLDLGAFIGFYTLKHYKAHKLISIEALPLNYAMLALNVELNALSNVATYNFAIWSEDGFLPMFLEKDLISSSTLIKEWHGDKHLQKVIYVKALSFDTMMTLGLLPSNIDIAKIDIEGAEHQFIKGGKKSLERGIIQRMVLELHNVVDKNSFYKDLLELKYKILKKLEGSDTEIVYAIFKG